MKRIPLILRQQLLAWLLFGAAVIVGTVVALSVNPGEANGADRNVSVACGQDLDAKVNSDPAGTATMFVLGSCSYPINDTMKFEDGDGVRGPAGTVVAAPGLRGTNPQGITAELRGTGVDQLAKPQNTFSAEWVRFTGGNFTNQAGTGVGIAGGQMANDSVIRNVEFIGNEGVGMSNAHGTLINVEAGNNGSDASRGFIAGGVKAIQAITVQGGYYHDNIGNGVWCDEGCDLVSGHPNGFWISNIAAEGNSGGGIRYEIGTGKALIENNHIYGNSVTENRGGISVRDAQNAVIEENIFDGSGYPHNQGADKIAVHASDSGRADRADLRNIVIRNNDLNGERIKSCGGPVTCSNNAP